MGWQKKETKPVPFHRDTGIMTRSKNTDLSAVKVFKMVCYTLFDVSPASAFLENNQVINGLPALNPPEKLSNNSRHKHLGLSNTLPVQRTQAPSSKLLEYEVNEQPIRSRSLSGSPTHGGGKFRSFFRRKSSKSKIDIDVTSLSNPSSLDHSSRDVSYSCERSSGSWIEIEVEENSETYANYNDDESCTGPRFDVDAIRLSREIEVLKKRLENQDQEVKKLKDEVSSLRSSPASSLLESARSDCDRTVSLPESPDSDTYDDSSRAISLPGSSRSTSDKYDEDSQMYIEFCQSLEGQLVKIDGEHLRSMLSSPQASEHEEMSIAIGGKDVTLETRSLLPKYGLEYQNSVRDLNTFLSDAAALGKRGSIEEDLQYDRVERGIANQSPEGRRPMVLPDQSPKNQERGLELEVASSDEQSIHNDYQVSSRHEYASILSQEDDVLHHSFREALSTPGYLSPDNKENHGGSSVHLLNGGQAEGVQGGNLQEDSEWLSQDFGNLHAPKKKSANMSIMEFGIPADPEFARRRREVQLRYQEVEEKLMKILRSPRRDYSSGSMSSSSSSGSSSGTSSPVSIEGGSPWGSFRRNDFCMRKSGDYENDCPNDCSCRLETESSTGKSDGQFINGSTKTPIKDLDLELSSPKELLFSKFGSKLRWLPPPSKAEACEDDTGSSPSLSREVYFHPILSKDLLVSVLSSQQGDAGSREGVTCPAAVEPWKYTVEFDGKKAEDSPPSPISHQYTVVSGVALENNTARESGDMYSYDSGNLNSNGSQLFRVLSSAPPRTRFGLEAARLGLRRTSSDIYS